MNVIFSTNIGMGRTENQDKVIAEKFDDNVGLVIVCDGMGGENAGRLASETACQIIYDKILTGFSKSLSDNMIKNLLVSSVVTANSVVYNLSLEDDSRNGMGTTAVVALAYEDTVYIVNVGDSRAYIIDEDITCVTKDHSVVYKMYENGEITFDEIKTHPKRNLITKAVGVLDSISPDYFEVKTTGECTFLLCSDGLSNYLDEQVMLQIIKDENFDIATEKLINAALENNASDNISVGIIKL